MDGRSSPARVIKAAAPIRVCDNGGWTDTWFAGHGKVFNIGVRPFVEVVAKVHPVRGRAQVQLDVESFGDRYSFELADLPDRHPLLEAAIAEVGLPDDLAVEISISSEAPPGGSTGTSAAAAVAVIGALDALTPGRMTPREVADTAHRVEVDRLGIQSGIQDQLCAAFGGINYIEIHAYPQASISQLEVPDDFWNELDRRLVLVFLGHAHVSTETHDRVIAALADEGPSSPRLEELRQAAEDARDAVCDSDFVALGRAMRRNTAAQASLHPDVVSRQAWAAIEVAADFGVEGWKVNGAGGPGGSVSLLCGSHAPATGALVRAVQEADPFCRVIPTALSRHGLRVWESGLPRVAGEMPI